MTAHDDGVRCPGLFHAGELVDFSGDGFAANATVTLTVWTGRATAVERSVTADADGAIALTAALPANLTGLSLDGNLAGYAEANGPGDSSTDQSDNILFNVGPDDAAACATVPSLSILLTSTVANVVSEAGAVFAVTGPGLPTPVTPPVAGTFAELDTHADGESTCPAREPAGVVCDNGAIGPLEPNATYVVTDVAAPPDFALAAPKTITVDDGSYGPDGIDISTSYTGTAVTASVMVRLDDPTGHVLPGPATFAVSGPGLPSYRYGQSPGTYAELDVESSGLSVCPAREPVGVVCANGRLTGLRVDAPYDVEQLTAPPGYGVSGGRRIITAEVRNPTLALFDDYPTDASTSHT